MRKTLIFIVIVSLLISIAYFGGTCVAQENELGQSAYKRIPMEKSKIIIDDGDTVEYEGITIRVLGLDTPEIKHPEHGFYRDQPFGRAATALAKEYIINAKTVEYIPCKKDKYGRTLAHVLIDGVPLAVLMVRHGLAYETVSYYGDNGFPGYAREILEAAKHAPNPPFIAPHKWRKKNRDKK
ncbi:MAG: thermonuclease family protein [Candidatus Eremiobacteraeota bacterium]|nr:thermonuclease family protein [Candidatus Eremiobacteraeota bacterium]